MADQDEPTAVPESWAEDAPQPGARSRKEIRIGSLFGPSYIESYAEAWKVLLPNVRTLALPVLYLQRHTFELLVKELLVGALEARSELYVLDDLFGTATSAGPPEPDDFERAHTTHSFGELFPCLERNLAALRRPSLPELFTTARKLFTDVDEDQPDRLRYETMFRRKQRTTQRSFPTGHGGEPRKIAPCHEVGSLLNELLLARSQALSAFVNHTTPPPTELSAFYTAACESSRELEAEVLQCLSPLTAATRDGSITWDKVSSKGLNVWEHEVLRRVKSEMAAVCLETRFRDRLLTIVILEGSPGGFSWRDSSFFLAARRPNGTLTGGVWVSEYQSDLIYEIQEAFKRTGTKTNEA